MINELFITLNSYGPVLPLSNGSLRNTYAGIKCQEIYLAHRSEAHCHEQFLIIYFISLRIQGTYCMGR